MLKSITYSIAVQWHESLEQMSIRAWSSMLTALKKLLKRGGAERKCVKRTSNFFFGYIKVEFGNKMPETDKSKLSKQLYTLYLQAIEDTGDG